MKLGKILFGEITWLKGRNIIFVLVSFDYEQVGFLSETPTIPISQSPG